MRFSVVIPAHNVERYIHEALGSVAGQRLAAFEVIVVDDGSTDGTVGRVEQCQKELEIDVRLLGVNCRNAAAARNAGILEARGDWIAFLDSDDRWDADHLERIARLIEASGDGAYLCRGYPWDGANRQVLPTAPWPWNRPRHGLGGGELLDAVLRAKVHTGTPFTAASREVLNQLGGFNPAQRYRHDLELWLRLAKTTRWTLDPHPSVGFRYERSGGISKRFPSIYRYEIKAYERHTRAYDPRQLQAICYRLARHIMLRAFADASPGQRRRAWAVAWRWLRWRYRIGFGLASLWPGLAGAVIRWGRAKSRGRSSQTS